MFNVSMTRSEMRLIRFALAALGVQNVDAIEGAVEARQAEKQELMIERLLSTVRPPARAR
jgi:hypothetical protein